jgi:hypothetical protein
MRYRLGGLALAVSFLLSSCSQSEAPAPAGPAALALPVTEDGHGVLTAQSVTIMGKGDAPVAAVAMTPNWWVGSGTFKISWFAGQSQTKRFFVISNATADAPAFLKHPEEGVREVKVSFDGAALTSIRPTATKAEFPIPAGAKAVAQVQVTYGPEGDPETVTWK